MSASMTSEEKLFVIDQSRCIGCRACVQACSECGTHRGHSLIQLDFVDRGTTTQTVPTVCMHCEDPTCAEVCPADAIKKSENGVVQSALKPRCIACSNCVLACPFGIPKMMASLNQMMKCDMCFDRTSQNLAPMCASVCPSGALYFGTRDEIEKLRPRSEPVNTFRFGEQIITTKVNMMVPRDRAVQHIDVTAAMDDAPVARGSALEDVFETW